MNRKKQEKAFLEKYGLKEFNAFPVHLPRFGSKLGDITDSDLEILSRYVGSIDRLILSENEITNQGLSHLSQIMIKTLEIDGNSLDDHCLPHLIKMKSLVDLNIRHTAISVRGLMDLIENLPNLKSITHTLNEADHNQIQEIELEKPDLELRISYTKGGT
ncbi:MAG: hypothetical protein ACJLTB_13615 [Algoriphagus aquaeductus]|uniref:hypothetical protein n=1 Tax=Algoriphagus aquaeductus TaxID=475299 RepID=UPI0038796314